jgi:crotonobetainyl-CoA:carnitine CoA-transferase CaiB-like acyl-CoA transferase
VAERVRSKTADEWIARLGEAGVPCGVVKTVLEALRDVSSSPLTGIAPSVPGSVRLPPPRLDEQGDEIRRLGWSAFGP